MQKQQIKNKPKPKSRKNKRRQGNQKQSYQLPADLLHSRRFIFKYASIVSRTSTVTQSNYTFQSSCYDPDLTGTGLQPYNWDQVTTLYQYYRVDRMQIYIEASNSSAVPVTVCCFPTTTSSLNTAQTTQFMQYPSAKWKALTALTGGQPIAKFQFSLEPHKMLGLSIQDDALKSYIASNPAALAFINMGHQSSDLTTSSSVNYNVQIDYYVSMMNISNPGDSITEKLMKEKQQLQKQQIEQDDSPVVIKKKQR